MATKYKVKEGDTLNSIAQNYGFSNYKEAGISSVPSGNFDLIRPDEEIEIGNYDPNKASTINTGSPVVSSSDRTGEYKDLSADIDKRDIDESTIPDPTKTDKTNTTTTTTTGKDALSEFETSGDPVYDAYIKTRKEQQVIADKWEEDQKKEINKLLPQTLAMINSTYKASMLNINSTYEGLIDNQIKINNLDMSRVKAYSVQNGAQYMPLEFTSAISSREREHSNSIKTLENERNALVAKAKQARDEGRVGAMRDNLADLRAVEKEMQERVTSLMKEVETRFEIIVKAREEKEKKRVADVQKQMQRASFMYLDDFDEADDPEAVDKIIKNIIKDSGGLLTENDYYDIYASMSGSSADRKESAMKMEKDQLAIDKAKADINNVNNTIYNRNRNTDSLISDRANSDDPKANVYADINEALGLMNEDGNPVVGEDGYVNPDFFEELMMSAKEDGVPREDFMAEYGHLINPDPVRIKDYKLTQEEIDKLERI
jgi:hypothetical protein